MVYLSNKKFNAPMPVCQKDSIVEIDSKQTSQKRGKVIYIEYDPVWGFQYKVSVLTEYGPETFWLRENEIIIK